jgi:2-phosphoglycerate kinase
MEYDKRKESVIVEGVHLIPDEIDNLRKHHPSVIPFILFISNKTKVCICALNF